MTGQGNTAGPMERQAQHPRVRQPQPQQPVEKDVTKQQKIHMLLCPNSRGNFDKSILFASLVVAEAFKLGVTPAIKRSKGTGVKHSQYNNIAAREVKVLKVPPKHSATKQQF